jgi:hypothetical protein
MVHKVLLTSIQSVAHYVLENPTNLSHSRLLVFIKEIQISAVRIIHGVLHTSVMILVQAIAVPCPQIQQQTGLHDVSTSPHLITHAQLTRTVLQHMHFPT